MVSHGIGDMLFAEELFNRTWNRQIAILPAGRMDRLFEIAPNPLESVARLFGQPLDDAPIVVAVADDVVKRREAVSQTVGSSCRRAASARHGDPTTPQSCVAEYIGKQGARVPSTRMMSVF
jgi:hypothetical protein